MGTSPRSRWSNRDDTSYQEKKSEAKTRTKRQPYDWVKPKADSSAPMLFVGQLTSLISLLMFNAGTGSSGSESLGGSTDWGLGGTALAVTILLVCFPSSSYSESRSPEMLQNVGVESLEFGC